MSLICFAGWLDFPFGPNVKDEPRRSSMPKSLTLLMDPSVETALGAAPAPQEM